MVGMNLIHLNSFVFQAVRTSPQNTLENAILCGKHFTISERCVEASLWNLLLSDSGCPLERFLLDFRATAPGFNTPFGTHLMTKDNP